jgi:enamine deaminase RidA (YjgF/YER057c/UK114 family)
MSKAEDKIKELGLVLPPAPEPMGAYVPFTKSGKMVFVSGQLPRKDGKVICAGKVSSGVSIEKAQEAAKLCGLNALSVLKAAAGDLDRVKQILRLTCWVASDAGFFDQPKVANGASDLMLAALGEAGKHSRMTTGVNVLPGDATVAVDLIAELK